MKALKLFQILFAFALLFMGCDNPAASDGVPNLSISLSSAGENAVRLALKGGKWDSDVATSYYTDSMISGALTWTKFSGGISGVNYMNMAFTRESDTVLLVEFLKWTLSGTGVLEIGPGFAGSIWWITDIAMADLASWTIHKNDPVTIDIK